MGEDVWLAQGAGQLGQSLSKTELGDRASARLFDEQRRYEVEDRWADLLPRDVAVQQAKWERVRYGQGLRASGLTLDDVSRRLGVSKSRAGKLLARPLGEAPVAKYLSPAAHRADLFQLSELVKKANASRATWRLPRLLHSRPSDMRRGSCDTGQWPSCRE